MAEVERSSLTEPPPGQRFKPLKAKEVIAALLKAKLTGAAYNPDNCSAWAKELADEVKAKLKGRLRRGDAAGRPACARPVCTTQRQTAQQRR
jgi:hypothetical protein